MIQQQSLLKVVDNSGAKMVQCIKVLGGFKRKTAKIGDVIVVSVKSLRNRSKKTSKVIEGGVYKAFIVRTTSVYKRKTNVRYYFNNNAVVLINKKCLPIGTRILTVFPRFLKKKKFLKILSLGRSLV